MVFYWWYKFEIEDRDVGVVDYESLEKAPIELPVVSVCIPNPFIKKRLEDIDPNIDTTAYLRYLKGDVYDQKYENIDYDNVTINLKDYLFDPMFNHSQIYFPPNHTIKHRVTFNGFYGVYDEYFVKCFSFQPNNKDYLTERGIKEVWFLIRYSQLIADLSVQKGGPYPYTYYVIHYPEQFLNEVNLKKFGLKLDEPSYISFKIDGLEILKRRNKRNRICLPDWKIYDTVVLKKHIENIGCVAPYHKPFGRFKKCTTKEKIKESKYDYEKISIRYPKACERIVKIDLKRAKTTASNIFGQMLEVHIAYPNEVKIITQTKEVDVHSLIGNIGGYIGLFLGKEG